MYPKPQLRALLLAPGRGYADMGGTIEATERKRDREREREAAVVCWSWS